MDSFKEFYYDKKGKYFLFFGFYLLFFIFLAIYIREARNNKLEEEPKEQEVIINKISTYDISYLINNDFTYDIEINDDDEKISFNGSKNNIDYVNYENRYFLDIYNINQLLKRSKLVNTENNILYYELDNSEISELLMANKTDGISKIDVYVNDKTEVEKITLDLSGYLDKRVYEITINYTIGENNENSSS